MNYIYFEQYGQGIPIIFLHGWMLNNDTLKHTFEPLFLENDYLNSHFQRIYIDLPGMGRSRIDNNYLNNEDYLNRIKTLLKSLNISSEVILVGHSYGGYICLALQEYFDVLGLFLIAPVTIASPKQRTLPTHSKNLSNDNFFSKEKDFIDFKINNFVISKENWLEYSKQILPAINVANKNFCTYYEANHYKYYNEDKFFTQKNSCKTMVVVGKNDYVVGFKDSLQFFQNFTNLDFLLINTCGHNIQIDQKEILLTHFKDFILSFKFNN